MQDEQDEIVVVTPQTFKRLLEGAGGWPILLLLSTIMILFLLTQIVASQS